MQTRALTHLHSLQQPLCQAIVRGSYRAPQAVPRGGRCRCAGDDARPVSPPDDRPVFESNPPVGEPTLFDARDAIETCSGKEGAEAEACFLLFGLDSQQTKKWYPIVSSLERQLELPYDDSDDDDNSDDKTNPWGLPSPLNEVAAMWHDAAEALMRSQSDARRL
eukprot:CAMPEP_0206148750 /NCGR_PEP_ID=MMETSP1473-20131121/37415_1 /ASSEMBLY_ACC=CAM_ASM_001109 /TAXON_ID=1461547 /ORGANISM="Stichococcus sp, Strain RCC1054" /LENGTH=163 /DNA_ID=CAMNT_0053546173 /DNA_START=701 /DNA_END=1192 /DNA_ORIENTATION=-